MEVFLTIIFIVSVITFVISAVKLGVFNDDDYDDL